MPPGDAGALISRRPEPRGHRCGCSRASPRVIGRVVARTYGRCDHVRRSLEMTDPRHLLLVGTGPGLGAAIARRFAREGFRLSLVARTEEPIATIAHELRGAGADVAVIRADAGDQEGLRAALAPPPPARDAPGVVIYNAALMTFDDLLTVSPEQL